MNKLPLRLAFALIILLAAAPARAAERIIALGAPAVEITCALGLGDKIIARAAWDMWPPKIRRLPQVGEPGSPNLELILRLKPDLVVADMNFSALAGRLKPYGIPAITLSAYNTHEVIPAVLKLAQQLGQPERGTELGDELAAMLELTENRLKNLPPEQRPLILALTGGNSYYSFSDNGGWSFASLAGGRNICASWEQPFPVISREWLAVARPDFVLISPYRTGYDENRRAEALRATWQAARGSGPMAGIPAVRQDGLIVIDDLLTFGLRSVPGTLYVAKKLHPERFKDIDPEKIHADFLQKYFEIKDTGRHIYP